MGILRKSLLKIWNSPWIWAVVSVLWARLAVRDLADADTVGAVFSVTATISAAVASGCEFYLRRSRREGIGGT